MIKNDLLFSIGGEGGSISIYRHQTPNGVIFNFNHDEFDPTDEGLDVHKQVSYPDNRQSLGTEHLYSLLNSINKRQQITFDYYSFYYKLILQWN